MCVRYTLHDLETVLAAIARALGSALTAPVSWKPRYNVTLTSLMPVVALASPGGTQTPADRPEVRVMKWGFGGRAKNPKGDSPGAPSPSILPNAKAETVATLPTFRDGVARRRCLVPANGFYEWQDKGGVKLPHLFILPNDEPFTFAGIWDPPATGQPETYCILTTAPNSVVAPIHNRMPVLLTAETMPLWLGDRPLTPSDLQTLTQPLPASRLTARPVSRYVSPTRNEGPRCLAPADPPEPELF